MKRSIVLLVLLVAAPHAGAQESLLEPPDFSNALPGPVEAHNGVECMHVATGSIVPGDVDWVQVTLGFASARTVVDVDFAATSSRSYVLSGIVGGTTRFGMSDSNRPEDNLCGLGATSVPVGSGTDSALDMGATAAGTILNIAVSGASDSGFTGNHSQNFDYELWVYVLREDLECASDADCDDGVDCTMDRCDAVNGTCHNMTDDSLCNDGLFCNGVETCDAVDGCLSGTAPCSDDVGCDEVENRCAGCVADSECDDGVFCNGAERCVQGICRAGAAPTCDDGVECTADFCDVAADECSNVPRHNVCDDGVACNGRERCHPQEGCQPGPRKCGKVGRRPW